MCYTYESDTIKLELSWETAVNQRMNYCTCLIVRGGKIGSSALYGRQAC